MHVAVPIRAWLVCHAVAACFVHVIAAADPAPTVVGTWEAIDRHVAMGSLYQPVHGVRKRAATIQFQREGERLTGFAVFANPRQITGQERWTDGKTAFRKAAFDQGKLILEWDIEDWYQADGPIAVEEKKVPKGGSIRVEALLAGDRLVGTWHMFVADGSEVFRGEWEAVRSKNTAEPLGKFLLIGGRHQDLTAEIRARFLELAGGNKAKIVVIPTAVADASLTNLGPFRQPWLELKPHSVEVLHTRNKDIANDPAFVKPLTEATAVFFTNGHRDRIFDAYRGTLVEKELKQLVARGGLVGGTGTGAVVLGELTMIRGEELQAVEPGLGIVPNFLIEDRSDVDTFPAALAAHPGIVGLLVHPESAVEISGSALRVVGSGTATVRLASGGGRPGNVEALHAGDQRDLTALTPDAAAQTKP